MSRMEDFKQEKSSIGQIFGSDSLDIEGGGGSLLVGRGQGGATAVGDRRGSKESEGRHESDGELDDDLDLVGDVRVGVGGVPGGVAREQVGTQQLPYIDACIHLWLTCRCLSVGRYGGSGPWSLHCKPTGYREVWGVDPKP